MDGYGTAWAIVCTQIGAVHILVNLFACKHLFWFATLLLTYWLEQLAGSGFSFEA